MNVRFTFSVGDATHAFTIAIEPDNSNWRQYLIISSVVLFGNYIVYGI